MYQHIDNSNNSPKENKNNENLPLHSKTNVPLIFDKNISSPQKSFRTPPKRSRALSGNENDIKASQVSSIESVPSLCKSPSNKGPLSTTIWRWSPVRGKFKPKSIEYQNGAVVVHPEDEFLLAAPFKSKWQSVSQLIAHHISFLILRSQFSILKVKHFDLFQILSANLTIKSFNSCIIVSIIGSDEDINR